MSDNICEKCGEAGELTLVHILTGKRGRPPKRLYCANCVESSADAIIPGSRQTIISEGRKPVKVRSLNGFDSAALFLLGMRSENLFEPCGEPFKVRCKGCRGFLALHEKNEHYETHKRELVAA